MRTKIQGGFTLVEILTVITLIAILMALVMGGVGKVKTNAAIQKTQSDLNALDTAIKSYKTEYEVWPGNHPNGLQAPATWEANNAELLKYLVSSNPISGGVVYNSRGIAFWEATTGPNLTLRDFWQTCVRITVDPVNSVIILQSAGPDKKWGTRDDIKVYDD